MSTLRHAITSFKDQLERRQQDRRTERIARSRAEQEADGLPPVQIASSPDVRVFFGRVTASVTKDRDRYHVEVNGAPRAAEDPASDDQDAAALAHASVAPGLHMLRLWEMWQRNEQLIPHTTDTPAVQNNLCAALLLSELSHLMQDPGPRPVMAGSVLLKVKQSVQAYLDGRTNDTVTLLKNALHTDPHNHTILAILSQILYHLATKGVQNSLPEARDYAQRSTIYSEKQRPAQLAFYRYMAIVTERAFGPERAMEWLRETGMLSPEVMIDSDEGIMVERGIYLRAWALLADIPVELWQDSEFNALKALVTKVIGGAALYMALLRGPLLAAASMSKVPMPLVEDIERLLHSTQRAYAEHASALKQLPPKASDKPWLLRVRFLNAVVQVAPLPHFDQAICQFSLDGQSWNDGDTPDPELRATVGLREISYWRLWALVLTPFKDMRQPYLLPAEDTMHDGELLGACDELLATLAGTEKQLIKAHLWEDLKPWMVRWQLDHLLAASTGSNKPRSRFAPSLAPYTSLYRVWQEPPVSGLLPSEIIAETAARGGFANLFEVVAALEGAAKLINDPVHGLVASQKRALQAANKYNPAKFKSVSAEFGGVAGGGLLMMALPLGMLGIVAAVVTFSANWGQALGLILAMGGIAGVVALNLKK